jgi:hypothetical protein
VIVEPDGATSCAIDAEPEAETINRSRTALRIVTYTFSAPCSLGEAGMLDEQVTKHSATHEGT